jgi:hypothetical protein
MKKNLFLFVFIASALVALSSCKKEYLVEVNGVVQGTVRDGYNNPIKDATVVLDGAISTATTDSLGYYKITGIAPGEHIVVFSKTGYATVRNTFSILSPNAVANTTTGQKQSFDYYAVVNPSLNALKGQIKGYVRYNDVALANAQVIVYLNSSYEPNVYTTTTNEVGAYSFNNLPAQTNLTVVAIHPTDPSTEGSVSISSYSGNYAITNGVLLLNDINVSTEPLDFVKGDYFSFENGSLVNKGVDTTASITITFTDNVSQVITQNKGGYAELRDYSSDETVASTVTYAGNKITFKPANYLTYNSRYYVRFKVYSSESKYTTNSGNVYNTLYNFYTKPRVVAALSGTPVISLVSNAIHLGTPTTNAKGYDIYASEDGKTQFQKIATENTLTSNYSVSSYATGATFYVVPVTWDAYGVRTYGTASAVITK